MQARFYIGGGLAFILALGIQYLALGYVTSHQTIKDASNYWSTVARLQAGASIDPEIVLVGSSITGRLPGAEQGNQVVSNLGSDGGTGAEGVDRLLNGLCALPELVVFETNTLDRYLISGPDEGNTTASGPWFKAGVQVPAVSAQARPSAMLYSMLLGRPGVLPEQVEPYQVESAPEVLAPPNLNALTEDEMAALELLAKQLEILQQRGVSVWLVQYPSKAIDAEKALSHQQACAWLSARLQAPFWDLQAGIDSDLVEMTDAIHMGPNSAARVLSVMMNHSQEVHSDDSE